MKTSVSLFLSDILQSRRKLYHKIVKNKIIDGHTPAVAIPQMKEAGIQGMEVCLSQFIETTDEDIVEVKAIAKKYDFPVLSVHQVVRFFTTTKVSEIARLCEIADMLSAKIVVLHINSARKQIFRQEYVDALHDLEKKYGVIITFENMEKYIGSLPHKHRWHEDRFAELIDKTDFAITLDTVHLAHSGGDILTFFKKNKKRIKNIHLSDYRYHRLNSSLRPMRYKHMPLGKGELPIKEFLKLLKKENYTGLLTMEIHTDLQGICKSASIINETLA